MIFSHDIEEDLSFVSDKGKNIKNIKNKVSFVAIKNGKHNGIGYMFGNYKIALPNKIMLSETNGYLKN